MMRLFLAILSLSLAGALIARERDLVSEEGRYQASFPAKVKNERKEVAYGGAVGESVELHTDRCDGPTGTTLAVSWVDYPEEMVKEAKPLLGRAAHGMKGLDGKITRLTPISFEEGDRTVAGIEVQVEAGKNGVRARLFLCGSRLYLVMAAGPKGALASPQATKFLDSFRIAK